MRWCVPYAVEEHALGLRQASSLAACPALPPATVAVVARGTPAPAHQLPAVPSILETSQLVLQSACIAACLGRLRPFSHPRNPHTHLHDPSTPPASPQVKLPLDVGTLVDGLWRDGLYHQARIIERRKVEGTEDYEYYVHYRKCEPRGGGWGAV